MRVSPRIRSMVDFMANAAAVRATSYRQQAEELREMAATGDEDDGLRRDLLQLAERYDALAKAASSD